MQGKDGGDAVPPRELGDIAGRKDLVVRILENDESVDVALSMSDGNRIGEDGNGQH
jgi:hypothetical protein